MPEQHELARRLVELCPNLRAITYEDPRFDEDGALEEDNVPSWNRLLEETRSWRTPSRSSSRTCSTERRAA
jgi:hypothetical protein